MLVSPRVADGAKPSPVTQLDTVVVSASARPTPLSQVPASTTVITRADIEAQQPNRLSEMLQPIEGIHVDEMGGRGGLSSIYIRGGDPNFTLVMLDGVPINDPTNQRGGSADLSSLTPERIERIEIIRGPLSALYGSEAVSGVINIITQSGQDESRQRVRLAGGRFGFTREVLQAQGPFQGLNYSFSLSHTRNDEQVEGDRFELGTMGWHLKTNDVLPVHVQFTGQYTLTNTRMFPEGSGGPRLALLKETEKRNTHELLVGLKVSDVIRPDWQQTFTVNLFRRLHSNRNPGVLSAWSIFQIPPNSFETTYTRILPRWQHTLEMIPDWSFTAGVQLISEIAERTGVQQLMALGAPVNQMTGFRQSRLTGAIFAELSATPFAGLHATIGGRWDIPEKFQSEFNPRVALSYQATSSTRLRAGYGEGFKLPSLAGLGDPIIGNSNLQPETSQGWDIGLQHSLLGKTWEVEVTYFHHTFSGLIDLDPNLAQMGTFRLVNLQEVTTQGLEFSMKAVPFPELFIRGFLTYVDADIRNSSGRLRNRPKWSGGMVLAGSPIENFWVRGQVRAVGKRFDFQIPTPDDTVAGYVKGDFSLTYHPSTSWRVFGVVENITNANYEEFLGFPAPRVNFRFGIEYRS